MVVQADNTLVYIKKKVRRLTASASENSLSNADLEQYINQFYSTDFPYAIKMDQMRSVYTFFTRPYIDRYPLDVNYNQGVRAPLYVEGIEGQFFKDRQQFYNMWPRWPTKFQPIAGDGLTTTFTFTIPGPFLSKEVVLGGVDAAGNAISVNDDGNGNLLLEVPNPVATVPPYNTNGIAPIPGMHNQNTGAPGIYYQGTQTGAFTNSIGTVNYVTGVFSIEFPVAPAAGTTMTLWVSQYQTGRPYTLLFWNNEFTIRPVPKLIHKVEIETYLSPVQFLQNSDSPILNQWAKYIAVGAAMLVLQDRQDMDGVQALVPVFDREESLVLERQAVEEIGQRNATIFSSSVMSQGWNAGNGGVGWY